MPIALTDTTVDSVFYHGTITSQPKIRTSISLSKSTAKTGNISLSIANFNYKGDGFSAELWGARKYINRDVRIYSQLNGDSTFANCLQVYSGRLVDVSHDINSIKLSITEQRPWDFISIPQDISSRGNYFPVVYGSYTVNSSTYAAPAYSATLAKAVHPIYVDKASYFYFPLVHEDYGSTDIILHYYESSLDSFIPLEDSNDSEAYDSGFAVPSRCNAKRHFKAKPLGFIGSRAWTNGDNAIDGTSDQTGSGTVATIEFGDGSDTSSPYSIALVRTNIANFIAVDDPPLLASSDSSNNYGFTLEINWKATNVYCITNSGASVDYNHIAVKEDSTDTTIGSFDFADIEGTQVTDGDEDEDSGVTITQRTFSYQLSAIYKTSGGFPDGVKMEFERLAAINNTGGSLVKLINDDDANLVSVYDIRAKYTLAIDKLNDTTDGAQRIASIKKLYSGHDGFAKSFAGGSGTASTGLEAHRDLLVRFTGWDAADSAIYNWDDSYPANVDSGSDLDGGINTAVTSIGVDDGDDFKIGNIIKITSEKMLVTNISSNTLTVTREYLGTTAAEHADNAGIDIVKSSIVEDHRVTTAWNIRWWALEPVELKKVLEQLQYEFGFIFKWRHDGTGSYWFIKDSYSSSEATLKASDISNLKINNTPFSGLLTDMRISYEKHPAENRYLSSQTSKDTTNNPRTVWNIKSKENIKEVNLDMNVNKPGNTDVGHADSDINDGFADYYMNIFGDIKKIISCDIINPAVSYNLETGDIIQFSNTAGEMPVEPFGDNWADYYMITDLKRSPGKVSITAREVG